MKNVVIVYGLTDERPSIPSRAYYREAYEYFYALAAKEGLCLSRTSLSSFDFERSVFSTALTFNPTEGWHEIIDVKPDLIEDRSRFTEENHLIKTRIAKQYLLLNDPEFTKIANSKLETSKLLPEYFKAYKRASSGKEFLDILSTLHGKYIVVKPEFGSGGNGVIIETPEVLRSMEFSYPVILQEFIDSSHGIPGITSGYHDLRLVFINNDLIYSYIRIPKEGSLLANVAQGGSMQIVEPEALPSSLHPVIRAVQAAFARFPKKIYTIDLLFDENAKPWIVELNTMPGIYFSLGQEKERDRFYTALIREFKNSLSA